MNKFINELGWRLKQLWQGRASRATWILGTSFYIGVIVALFAAADLINFTAPKLLWEFYIAFTVSCSLICILGITRLYSQRLHDMGLSGYWTFLILAVGPIGLLSLASEYDAWRFDSFGEGAPPGFLDAVMITIALALLLIGISRPSQEENVYGAAPPVIFSFFDDAQIKWTTIILSAVLAPTFTYLGYFGDQIWLGRSENVEMPLRGGSASDRVFMKCWGIQGARANWTMETSQKEALSSFPNGFQRDGYDDTIWEFLISEDGQLDIVTNGILQTSYKKDGFSVLSAAQAKIDFSKYDWEKQKGSDAFNIFAVADNEDVNNVTAYSFVRENGDEPISRRSYKMIFTKNIANRGGLLAGTVASGQVMIGDCIVQ